MAVKTTRKLGRSGMEVSPMGLGCWAIGGPAYRGETPIGWGEVDDNESIRAVQRAIDLGVNFFDTANVYGAGHSERVLGRALEGRRDQVIIATKFGNLFDEASKQAAGTAAEPVDIQRQCEESLRCLNTDHIDLYQFHLGGYPLEQVDEVLSGLETLVQQGKIRAFGWSTDDVERERAFARSPHCAAVQFQENVLVDNAGMVALCDELDLAGINRGPLAMGLLTGKYSGSDTLGIDDVRGTRAPDWMRFFKDGRPNPEFMQKINAVREILTSGGRSLAQGALAWLWARSPHLVPIPGFRTVKQVEEDAGAMRFGPLTQAQMQEIDRILER